MTQPGSRKPRCQTQVAECPVPRVESVLGLSCEWVVPARIVGRRRLLNVALSVGLGVAGLTLVGCGGDRPAEQDPPQPAVETADSVEIETDADVPTEQDPPQPADERADTVDSETDADTPAEQEQPQPAVEPADTADSETDADAPAEQEQPQPAEEPADDWRTVLSLEGGFVAEFPGRPEQESEQLSSEAGVIEVERWILEREHASYIVSVLDLPEAFRGQDAESVLDGWVAGLQIEGASTTSIESITLAGVPGRDLSARLSDRLNREFRIRLFLVGTRIYQVGTVADGSADEDDLKRFHDSFTLLRSPN